MHACEVGQGTARVFTRHNREDPIVLQTARRRVASARGRNDDLRLHDGDQYLGNDDLSCNAGQRWELMNRIRNNRPRGTHALVA